MKYIWLCILLSLTACSWNPNIDKEVAEEIRIFPDYKYVTIPSNIAPLNFSVSSQQGELQFARYECGEYKLDVKATQGQIRIKIEDWHNLLNTAKGKEVKVTIICRKDQESIAYLPYTFRVAPDSIDRYIAYRLIEPGYEVWNQMGIYQRNLETFEQTPIIENKITRNNCLNCHAFCNRDPEQYLFHMRASLNGTVLKNGAKLEILDTKTDRTISSFTYPYWHPSGRFIAFSINKTMQGFHPTQRVEVYDSASDLIVYDIEKHEILATPLLTSKHSFETFPAFSPDGKQLYFCSAQEKAVPDSIRSLKYNLCRISFDAKKGTFGDRIDTLFHADKENKSFSFPRISPDGKFLIGTVSEYGTFPIWHKDADLYMINMETGVGYYPKNLNSNDTESYHSWSSNGRWLVFSSRRSDGLYTRLFIAYVAPSGETGKPFLLPLENPDSYVTLLKSFNIPEFITGKVENQSQTIRKLAEKGGAQVTFR